MATLESIDHVGIAVADLDAAVGLYTLLCGGGPVHRSRVADDGVEVALFEAGAQRIELLGATRPELRDQRLPGPPRRRPPPRRLRRPRCSGRLDRYSSLGLRLHRSRAPDGSRRAAGGLSPSRGRRRRARRALSAGTGAGRPVSAGGATDGEPFLSNSGIPLESAYSESPPRSAPGEYPFTRGIRADGYRARLWTMRQYAGFGSAEETNGASATCCEPGQTGLSVAFDLPTQMGYDSDDPAGARARWARSASRSTRSRTWRLLLRGHPAGPGHHLDDHQRPRGGAAAAVRAGRRGAGASRRPLGGRSRTTSSRSTSARGTYIYPPRPSMRLVTDTFAYCARAAAPLEHDHASAATTSARREPPRPRRSPSRWPTGSPTSRRRSTPGSGDRRLRPAALSFFFNVSSDFFEEVAKFRAARALWAGGHARALRRARASAACSCASTRRPAGPR